MDFRLWARGCGPADNAVSTCASGMLDAAPRGQVKVFLHDLQPAIPGGFPDGLRVVVTSGQYAGDRGEVVNRDPDLRPGSVWVALAAAGTCLVPGYRLAPDSSAAPSQ